MAAEASVLHVFRQAADEVPAYRRLLAEAGVAPDAIRSLDAFRRDVPVLDKQGTFSRFPLADLCRGGDIGTPAWVLTSSGHSGRFAFGMYHAETGEEATERIDGSLDAYFQVRSRKTLLINCLPMGVKVYTRTCTLAETSVREDMVVALAKGVAPYYDQTILVGETAFIKRVVELGRAEGVDWSAHRVQVVVGEEPLAENARTYLAGLLAIDLERPETGRIVSTMGVAELGLNLFFETPALIALRRALHHDAGLRRKVLGHEARHVPMLFAWDPERLFAEVLDDGRLVVTMLDPNRRLPLVRYATGDRCDRLDLGETLPEAAARAGILPADLETLPVLMVRGRGREARPDEVPLDPEPVKEGLYADADLAAATTANFRLRAVGGALQVRIQLAEDVDADDALADRYADAIRPYVAGPLEVSCIPHEAFGDGMSLDYERKFDYLGNA
jgi:phenylacetate-CoA ligase